MAVRCHPHQCQYVASHRRAEQLHDQRKADQTSVTLAVTHLSVYWMFEHLFHRIYSSNV